MAESTSQEGARADREANETPDPPVRSPDGDERPGHEPAIAEYTFGMPNLPEIRDIAAACARHHGADEEFVSDFLIAVNEVATNAVTHGAERARMRLWKQGGHLYVSVYDEGVWQPEQPPGRTPPPPHATCGMGLWVARLLSTHISFDTGDDGTTVTMGFKV
ncbi:ATP-binding protein [Thermostaphylospora chromogena]|uniref:Histidine kinase-like ATPase domain-containing protein n=1 Tax=Thermostaphylospora chromogena TaxID=35622 RepID=A0A1H1GI71_9ACTN|nr:ATP-binding protein [Thermostaphylospora chromogena]SDR12845.1 Histidine kinase-like ATPase domain-containing protein [Thermostaphylospora chromogena]